MTPVKRLCSCHPHKKSWVFQRSDERFNSAIIINPGYQYCNGTVCSI
jgi:hypothetical protein